MKEFEVYIEGNGWVCAVFYKGCCLARQFCKTLSQIEAFEDKWRYGVK